MPNSLIEVNLIKMNINLVKLFCKESGLEDTNIINENDHIYFRYLGFKFNYFMKNINLPKIKKNSNYEAVFIEFRVLPHIEFLIRNAIMKLGEEWSHTIVCGNENVDFIVKICGAISRNINIVQIDKYNVLPSEYSKLLTSVSFWNLFKGEKILIYQEDSFIFNYNINDFIHFDYIGAPFQKNVNDTPNLVGNGGFSLRSKSKMIEVIQKKSPLDTEYNSSTKKYMKNSNLDFPPEDVYFSKNMQELNIGLVADWDTASLFSSESVFNEKSFGGHKFWLSNKKWKEFFKKLFKYNIYIFQNNIDDYLKFNKISTTCNKTDIIQNAFDIDLYFFCKANNYPYVDHLDILKQIKNTG